MKRVTSFHFLPGPVDGFQKKSWNKREIGSI